MAKRSGLGKGLDALFVDNNTDDGSVTSLRITEIEPNKNQPRREFEPEALRELADSIRDHGVLQPLVVRSYQGTYQIVAGERRWRAARMAGLSQVPVVIRDLSDAQTMEIAIVENLQREDLNLIELAQGYKTLMEEHGLTQEQVAARVGKSRPVVANTIRMLSLPDSVLDKVRTGALSQGHAKALLALEEPALMEEVAQKVISHGLLVRDVEKIAQERKMPEAKKRAKPAAPNSPAGDMVWGESYYREMQLALTEELGRKVTILRQGRKTILQMEFYDEKELDELAQRLTGNQSEFHQNKKGK